MQSYPHDHRMTSEFIIMYHARTKGGYHMSVDSERIIARKAMAYDLRILMEDTPGLDADTVRAILKIMQDYIDKESAAEHAEEA